MDRKIIHIDMDAFYASIEERDNPLLKGLPLIIGHDHHRGVVSTASYAARKFGVHSAMPVRKALTLCPDAICIPPNLEKYQRVSLEIMSIFRRYTDLVESLSLDEAFLDLTASVKLFGDHLSVAQRIKEEIKSEMSLSCSIGISYNKFLAKLASDLKKPDGLTIINQNNFQEIVWPLSIRKIWGIGPKYAHQLEYFNIKNIGQLAQAKFNFLEKIFGSRTLEIIQMANGVDERAVVANQRAKSIGHEITFNENTNDPEYLKAVLLDLSGEVGRRLRGHGLKGKTIVLKIRYADFQTISRSFTLTESIDQDNIIYSTALELFKNNFKGKKEIRLIGITAANLHLAEEETMQSSLFAVEDNGSDKLYQVLDSINNKYGKKTLTRARLLKKSWS